MRRTLTTFNHHALRERQGAEAARTLVRTVLENTGGNVSKAATILMCSRFCVRRARGANYDCGFLFAAGTGYCITCEIYKRIWGECKECNAGEKCRRDL